MAKEVEGQWSDLFDLSNVAVHASLLYTGQVLYWGRRANPKGVDPKNPGMTAPSTLNESSTKAFLWDPSTKKSEPIAKEPLGSANQTVNLFCSGHCFLPDGTLLIVGGHLEKDGKGVNQACIFDPHEKQFTALPPMLAGRWYPSALTLPDGRALVISGSQENYAPYMIPQIWPSGTKDAKAWIEVKEASAQDNVFLNLYPRVHLSPKGHIFMAGPQAQSAFLEIKDANGIDIKSKNKDEKGERQVVGTWRDAKTVRPGGFRDYAPSVMYDSGKIMYIGGGVEKGGPTNMAAFIDLNDPTPAWKTETTNMKNARRQFNATVLPDGTVLVTGGTKGEGFNLLGEKDTVHEAELWDPETKRWTTMAKESADRCYHSIALLLPDGRVLSAGGGEWGDARPQDCLTNAQLFEPPYLFGKGTRPTIVKAPQETTYGGNIDVTLGTSDLINKVSWVRLGSVTHCRNMNQSLMFLRGFTQTGTKLTIPAPANANLAPPGHYMLFVLNKQGCPSKAATIRIAAPSDSRPAPKPSARVAGLAAHQQQQPTSIQPSLLDHDKRITAEQDRPPVVVGLTPVCPYGLGPCWGGAYEALHRVSDIDVIRPMPHQDDSVAFVYLKQDILPDIDVWRREFEELANRSYDMRGIEMTVSGMVSKKQSSGAGEQMTLAGTSTRLPLILAPFRESSQIKWDLTTKAPRPISDAEAGAYKGLSVALADHPAGMTVQVTGTLQKHGPGQFSLDVREFELLDAAAS